MSAYRPYLRAKAKANGGLTGRVQAQCAKCENPYTQYNSMHVYCDDCSPSKKQRNQEISRICGLCNEPFAQIGKGNFRYCPDCREKHPNSIPYQSKAPCETCGETFTHVNKEARFCSHSCSSISLNRKGLGPRHDDDELLARFVTVIKNYDECLALEELVYLVGTSAVVLAPRGWTIEGLYQAAGRTYGPPRLNSRFADRMYAVLSEIVSKSEIEVEKKLPGMRGVKGRPQFADFYVANLRLIVEADGCHHWNPCWGPDSLEYNQANDRKKDAYAKANGITLLRIRITEKRRVIKAQLLRTIRHLRPAPAALNPSNHLHNSGDSLANGSSRRMPKRGITRDRPGQ